MIKLHIQYKVISPVLAPDRIGRWLPDRRDLRAGYYTGTPVL